MIEVISPAAVPIIISDTTSPETMLVIVPASRFRMLVLMIKFNRLGKVGSLIREPVQGGSLR